MLKEAAENCVDILSKYNMEEKSGQLLTIYSLFGHGKEADEK